MLHLHQHLMEKLREIQELHPDAHFICSSSLRPGATEILATFRIANFDAFIPMSCVSEDNASFEEVNKLFCGEE